MATLLAAFMGSTVASAATLPAGGGRTITHHTLSAADVHARIDSAKQNLAKVEPRLSPTLLGLASGDASALVASPVRLNSHEERIARRLQQGHEMLALAQAEIATARNRTQLAHAYNHARRAERSFVKADSMLLHEEGRR